MELKNMDQSIQDRTISVETQPPTNICRRYETNGKCQMKNSRSKPMTIEICPYFSLTIKFKSIILVSIMRNNFQQKYTFIHIN